MISHKHRCIFIHIPKCGGSSIRNFVFDGKKLDWREPNYEKLYGWCPKRKIHLQHATSKQLLESDLISETDWNDYFKFTIVRNPWDRSYSDYLWIQKDRKVRGSFSDYIQAKGPFKKVLGDSSEMQYRGDHLLPQSDFFDLENGYSVDYVGRFEEFSETIQAICSRLNIDQAFADHEKKNKKRHRHYSNFYTSSRQRLVEKFYANDIESYGYQFEDLRTGIYRIKSWF